MRPYNVLGLGQPLVDNLVRLSDEHLTQLGIKEKGGSQLIHSQEEFESLLTTIAQLREQDKKLYGESPRSPTTPMGYVSGNQFYNANSISDEHSEERDEMLRRKKGSYLQPVRVPGGSCVNTIKGLAMLGEKCGVLGKIGTDESGTFYKDNLRERGVIPLMTESSHSRTGEVLCLVTPDGQRTMRAFLGASQDMNESDLLPQDFRGVQLVHIEGYAIYNKSLTIRAMQMAKRHNALVSFDLGSYELVRSFKPLIIELLRNYVDIVFANEEEANELTGGGGADQCVDYLATLCHVAVVMKGPKGCLVKSKSDKYRCPTKPVKAVDTTGAGDCFASGFLYAYLQGYSLEQCARLGSLAGGAVVQYVGAEIPSHIWGELKKAVNHEIFVKHKSSQNASSGSRSMPSSVVVDTNDRSTKASAVHATLKSSHLYTENVSRSANIPIKARRIP